MEKDQAFKDFLEKIQGQNKAELLLSALTVKYGKETAGKDADKREEQLDELATKLENLEKAITGMSVKFEFKTVINALENQSQILEKSLEEQALLRKVSEGSLEYDKESAQYRNVSGKELTSDVSGKTIKQGAYVDFETAANRLQGQGKRVRESEQNQINFKPVELGKKTTVIDQPGDVTPKKKKDEEITSFGNIGDLGKALGARLKGIYDFMTNKVDKKEDVQVQPEITNKEVSNKEVSNNEKVVDVKAKPDIAGINSESDNIQSAQEVMAESAKKDVELTAINNDLLEQQLNELKKISAALAPSTNDEPGKVTKNKAIHNSNKLIAAKLDELKEAVKEGGSGGSGGGVDALAGLAGMGKLAKKAGGAIVKGAKAVGKGALSLGGGIARFAASGAGKALGATAAVGLGAYTAYKGYTAAEDSKQAKLEEVQAKVDSGEMNPEEAATARKEIGNTATVEKSGAVGEGTGMAGGAIAGGMAGAKLGAAIGSIIPGAGTAIGAGIGTIAGGALGAFAGSSAGKYVGEKVGSGINAVKGFFGGRTDTPGAATKEALAPTPATVPVGGQPLDIAGEPYIPGQPLSQAQMIAIGSSKASGNKYSPEIEAQYAKQKQTAAVASMKDSGNLGKAEKLSGIKKEFQESEAKEAAAREKIKEFETANPFDVKPKGDIESGITPGKFNDPKKQAEYDKLKKEETTLGLQSIKIGSEYKEADVGRDVKPMSATYAAQLNKQAEEANAAGRHPTGKPFKTDYKEGDETGLSESDKRKKYTAALLEKGVAAKDIDPFRAKDQYSEQIQKELRSEKVTGGSGAKNPVTADLAAGAAAIPAQMQNAIDADNKMIADLQKEYPPDKYKFSGSGDSVDVIDRATGKLVRTYDGIVGQSMDTKALADLANNPNKAISTRSGAAAIPVVEKKPVNAAAPGDATAAALAPGMAKGGPVAGKTAAPGAGPAAFSIPSKPGDVFSNEYHNKEADRIEAEIDADVKAGGGAPVKGKRSIEAARSMRASNERSGQLAAAASASMGSEVSKQSTENSDLTREANMRQSAVQPIISSNVNNTNTQSFVPIKPSPRAERSGSALDRYNDRVLVF